MFYRKKTLFDVYMYIYHRDRDEIQVEWELSQVDFFYTKMN